MKENPLLRKHPAIRIFLVDDHRMFLEGLRSSLRPYPHIQIVGHACDARDIFKHLQRLHPDVVLMDLHMPGLDGACLTKRIVKEAPGTRVLMLTMDASSRSIFHAVRSGASGYQLKNASVAELVLAVESVARSSSFFTVPILQRFIDMFVRCADRVRRSGCSELSAREEQVLVLMAEGFTSKEMATQLGIGVRTVETHRLHIVQKLHIHTIAGLTKFAIAKGHLKVNHLWTQDELQETATLR